MAAQERENVAEKLRRGLELKKRLVETWEKLQKDPSGAKDITSAEQLLQVLEDVGFVAEMVRHVGQRKVFKIGDGRQISTVHLAESTKLSLAKAFFSYMDLDGNGKVSMNECLIVLDALSNPDRVERARFHFIVMDVNGDGKLDKTELKKLFNLTMEGMNMALELELQARKTDLEDSDVSKEDIDEARSHFSKVVFNDPVLADSAVQLLLQEADRDKDGCVQEKEWVDWISNEDEMRKLGQKIGAAADKSLGHKVFQTHPVLADIFSKSFSSILSFF